MAHAQTVITLSPEELADLVRTAVRAELEARAPAAPSTPARYLGARELAAHFRVSRATLHNWIHRDGCPHVIRGGVLRFELEAVEAWFRGRPAGLQRVK